MKSIPASPPVRLSDFELEVECPSCEVSQCVSDDVTLGTNESLDLLASLGAYRLSYSLLCWHCGGWMRGGFTIRSRRLSEAPDSAGYGPG